MKIVTVVGARPQFIKAATLSRAIANHNSKPEYVAIEEKIVHTGQHYDPNMSDNFFEELDIPRPHYHLNIRSGSQGAQTGKMLEKIETVLQQERPDCLLVYGDTNSTLAGALAAAKLHIPVAHIEAGLRSFNRKMPEEVNRVLCDHVSNWLFCPTQSSVTNLEKEGITQGVEYVGDLMYDGMLYYQKKASQTILDSLSIKPNQYILSTIHRAENTDNPDRLKAILQSLGEAADAIGTVILPLHPRTRKILSEQIFPISDSIQVIEPAPYLETIALLQNARAIMTDSGGMQKEAFFLQTPCLTLRDETEWVETINCGSSKLVGADRIKTRQVLDQLFSKEWKPNFSAKPYGMGKAADSIVMSLVKI
jgi:UDP-N-acetylglucosamine 2-epimerase